MRVGFPCSPKIMTLNGSFDNILYVLFKILNGLILDESVEWNASKFVIFLEYENQNWFINKLVLVLGILFPENSLLVIENDDSYLFFKIMIYFLLSTWSTNAVLLYSLISLEIVALYSDYLNLEPSIAKNIVL